MQCCGAPDSSSDDEELEVLTGLNPQQAQKHIREDEESSGSDGFGRSDLTGEWLNIFLLCVLYTLQGIPMGLSAVMPLLLKEGGVSFRGLSTFSLHCYPFSLKLLWAPIVDALFIERFGRRKTWMVPAQLLIGGVMVSLSFSLNELLFVEEPCVTTLTTLFFLLYFLCATQDIAVDGWAITMLRKENVCYAATCNSVGQTLGYALGFTGFMLLQHFELATMQSFMFFWGVVFVVVTLLVAALKEEAPVSADDVPEDVPTAYRQMLAMLQLRPMRALMGGLFTWKVAFAVVDSIAPLKLQEYGIPKEHLAYMTTIVMPVYILLPVVVARWTSSGAPLDLALRAYPWRVALVPITAGIVYLTPFRSKAEADTTPVPWLFYCLVLAAATMGAIASQCMFVSQMAFFAYVSDPAMGGTYMTLLNTLSNLGGMWPPTVAMMLVDATTCPTCSVPTDGFYVMSIVCCACGVIWCIAGLPHMRRLQQVKPSEWRVPS